MVLATQTMEKIKQTIVVMMPHWLGDAVMALPALRYLKQELPQIELVVFTRNSLKELYQYEPCVDKIVGYKEEWHKNTLLSVIQKANLLRKVNAEEIIFMPNSWSSALLGILARIPRRVGYDRNMRRLALTESFPWPKNRKDIHQSYHFLQLIHYLLHGALPAKISAKLKITDQCKQNVQAKFDVLFHQHQGPIVAIGIGSAYGPAKDWSPERYKFLGQRLYREYGAKCVLLGTTKDNQIARMIAHTQPEAFVNLTGKTSLDEAMGILSQSNLFIGNDSGLAHLAAAVGTSTIVIFGSTSPKFTTPLGDDVGILYSELECSPCFQRTCPLGTMKCMRSISVEQAYQTVEQYLKRGSRE